MRRMRRALSSGAKETEAMPTAAATSSASASANPSITRSTPMKSSRRSPGSGCRPAEGEQIRPRCAGDVLAADSDRPLGRRIECADHVQQGRLAAPRGAEDDDELAAFDSQVHALERGDGHLPHVVAAGDGPPARSATFALARRRGPRRHAQEPVRHPSQRALLSPRSVRGGYVRASTLSPEVSLPGQRIGSAMSLSVG